VLITALHGASATAFAEMTCLRIQPSIQESDHFNVQLN